MNTLSVLNPTTLLGGFVLFLLASALYLAWEFLSLRLGRWFVFKDKPLLTPNEREFYGRLRRALPAIDVFPQVAMSALIDSTTHSNHPRFWDIRARFDRKVVDFVLCEPDTCRVLGVVELDDRTHDSKKAADAARDAMLKSVGIATARFDSRAKPAVADIARLIRAQGIELAKG